MSVKIPWRFPNRAEQIHEEALAFRRLSPDERVLRILDLIASGATLAAISPKREAARRLREQSEADWQRAFKELFARHGYSAAEPAAVAPDGCEEADRSA
jgi:hypothetical protein